jgi:tetratricopeptide (TPR) repeat protein
MSDALYERYKEALRRGHIAASRGRHDAALEAYDEAAGIAPDRALPFVGLGRTLAGLGRPVEALAAYEAALERDPTDEPALRGRADVLVVMGRRAEAADAMDRLATVLDDAGRSAEAADAARRGLELAESRGRRRGLAALAERVRALAAGDPEAAAALDRLTEVLEGGAGRLDGSHETVPPEAGETDAVAAPPFDVLRATAAVEDAVAAGDPGVMRAAALDAAVGLRAGGRHDAAIDACYLALAGNPADPDLHLVLTEVYLDLGWRALAVEKLILLDRIAGLSDDAATRARLCAIARTRLGDEERLAALCG